MIKSYAIVGVGMVGGALKKYFEKKGRKHGEDLFLYDPGRDLGSVEEVNKADVIFICVPTPFVKGEGFDLSYVEKSLENLTGEKIVVLKSTMVPGTTEKLQKKYSHHKILFNPEFLVEEKADEDMENPDRQIIGYTQESQCFAEQILSLLPKAPFEKIIRATEAEMVKYFGNNFLSMKVIFACQFYALCQKLGIDYEIVRKCASADERIGPSHLDVHHGGYLGYGGACLPKDIRALIEFADKQGIDLKLHKVVEQINNELMSAQDIEDPEKFSKRDL